MRMSADPFSAAYQLGLLGNPQTATSLLEEVQRRKQPVQGAKGTMAPAKPKTLSTAAQALFGGAL